MVARGCGFNALPCVFHPCGRVHAVVASAIIRDFGAFERRTDILLSPRTGCCAGLEAVGRRAVCATTKADQHGVGLIIARSKRYARGFAAILVA